MRKFSLFIALVVLLFPVAFSQNLMSNWGGEGATGAGSEPNNFGWDCSPEITWAEANVFGVRFQDTGHSYGGRILYVRWDGVGNTATSSIYSYPVTLEGCKTYRFTAKVAWNSNGSAPEYTLGINSSKDNSGTSLVESNIVIGSTGVLNDVELIFTTSEAGTYYFTMGASNGVLGVIKDLSTVEYSGDALITVSETKFQYDSLNLSNSFNISAYGLAEDVSFSGPTGMTFSPASVTAAQAHCGQEVTATFSNGSSVTSGIITISSGSLSKEIEVKEVLPPSMANGAFEFASDGTWCWFQDPRAVYYEGTKKQTYTGWITSDGDVQVASYNHETGEKIIHTIDEDFQVDDHNNPTFLVREDGRILVAYSGHFFGPMRVRVSTNPEDITSWGEEATFGNNVTYANPYQIGDSTVMFYRDGSTWHPTINISTDGGVTWGTPTEFITRGGSQQRPYAKYTQDSKGGMHIIFTTGHPRQEAANKVYYVYYKNSKFYKADGTFIKEYTGASTALDIDAGEPEVVYNASVGKGWTWDIALDENESPIILYAAFPNDQNHNYYYAYWDGENWQNKHIVNSGRWFPQTPEGATEPEPNYSGGMVVDPEDTRIVYLSKQVDGVFEIFKYITHDKGDTWETEQITYNSPENVLNVRPVIPRGHKAGSFDVMWMRGWYTTYQNYHTAVMYYSPNAVDADLDSIYVNGERLENFHPDTLGYELEVPEGTTVLPNVVGMINNPSATVKVNYPETIPGIVNLVVTTDGAHTSKTYSISLKIEVTLGNNMQNQETLVYPNPTTGTAVVDVSSFDLSNIRYGLYDINGRSVETAFTLQKNQLSINLEGQNKGLYILKLKDNNNEAVEKILKL